jgi:hypothetical protein
MFILNVEHKNNISDVRTTYHETSFGTEFGRYIPYDDTRTKMNLRITQMLDCRLSLRVVGRKDKMAASTGIV